MTAKPILYSLALSPPVRTVWMTARHIGLEFDIRNVDLLGGEQNTPEYLKLNPQHSVPTLDDNGQILTDSHAICTYIIGKFGNDDHPLYPKELYTRAKIDQRLHFDSGILFPRLKIFAIRVLFGTATDFLSEHITAIQEAYDMTETFLNIDPYMAGSSMTLADLACVTSIGHMNVIVPIDNEKYPKIHGWLNRMAELPYYNEINQQNLVDMKEAFIACLKRNREAAAAAAN